MRRPMETSATHWASVTLRRSRRTLTISSKFSNNRTHPLRQSCPWLLRKTETKCWCGRSVRTRTQVTRASRRDPTTRSMSLCMTTAHWATPRMFSSSSASWALETLRSTSPAPLTAPPIVPHIARSMETPSVAMSRGARASADAATVRLASRGTLANAIPRRSARSSTAPSAMDKALASAAHVRAALPSRAPTARALRDHAPRRRRGWSALDMARVRAARASATAAGHLQTVRARRASRQRVALARRMCAAITASATRADSATATPDSVGPRARRSSLAALQTALVTEIAWARVSARAWTTTLDRIAHAHRARRLALNSERVSAVCAHRASRDATRPLTANASTRATAIPLAF
eukprot:Opistho-2@34911